MRFHRRCGDRVTLLNDDYTAVRNFVEFNHGLVLSSEPLEDDVMFEVCIDRKVNVWNGSLEIGVTTLDPEYMELPATATKLRDQAWIMSGSSVVMDGVTLINSYGPELDTLREGDCVGVMRTSKAELLFYINGRCLGVAATDMPANMFAVIDLYGQCVQVTKTHSACFMPIMEPSAPVEEDPNNDDTLTLSEMEGAGLPPQPSQYTDPKNTFIPMSSDGACGLVTQDRLRFHPRCGILVKLSNNHKTAERARPLDDYNNGVVMTHRPLYDNELFEIRIDRLVDKWSGSIESNVTQVGVTTHNPATIRFPSTMTNMETGTIMMSGCKVLLNGHGTCVEYGNFNLDELREGDTVGMMRKSNGKLHYYVNGVDQGVATEKVDPQVWGVIDLYGMTVKVTIVDPCDDLETSITNPYALEPLTPDVPAPSRLPPPRIDEDSLLFHTLRDSDVIVINDGKTAHRPNAFKNFNNGIVMTNRSLRTNELFQVRLDVVIPKWAGSIEIGVTQQSPNDIKFPFKMSNAKSGTWAVTGEDVIRDGVILIPQYVRNLNKLTEGDTIGMMRKDLGILHFFLNGVDQGPAAFNVPEHVYGILDLYGRAAQATIVDTYTPPPIYSPESPLSTESNATIFPEMCFHRVHGRNARLSRNRLSAWRATVYSEFNDAVLFSSRPLRECDMFELRIDKMVDCWIGSLEIGVTAIRPEDLEASGGVGAVAGTATDLNWDTYILSGAAMMKDGECVRSGYPLDLDTLTVGSRVGMMWHADRSLHYYLDGIDMGKAWYVPHLNIYAVVDLYGQCTQVTILQNEERVFNYNTNSDNSMMSNSRALESPPPPYWSFSEYCGNNICLLYDYSMARRLTSDPMAALVFSSGHLVIGEMFEIKILECKHGFAGSFKMGITDINILNAHVNRNFPASVSNLPHYTAYIDGKYMKYTQPNTIVHEVFSFVPSLEWLRPGDRLGFKKTDDGRVLVYYNSELMDTAFERVPDKVYVVMEIYGQVSKIQAVIQGNIIPGINQLSNAELNTELPIHCPSSVPIELPSEYSTPAEVNPAMPRVLVPPTFLDLKKKDSFEVNPENVEMAPIAEQEVQPDSSTENVELPLEELPVASDDPVDETGDGERSEDGISEGIPTSNDDEDGERTPQDDEQLTDRSSSQPRRRHLPYTFYYVHGKNIRLCSSDTVAMRTSGYNDAIAIVSHPLRRGHNFRFRVDRMARQWWGTVGIGAIGYLPGDVDLPRCAVHMTKSSWFLTNDLIHDSGNTDCAPKRPCHCASYSIPNLPANKGCGKQVNTISSLGLALDNLTEHSVLTIHFRFNSELVLDIDGKVVGVIATIGRNHSHVFPAIDLYGKVTQVSVLLHPYVVVGGASLDLPVITENLSEETLAEQELINGESTPELNVEASISLPEFRPKRKMKTFSQENLLDDEPQPLINTESNNVPIEPVPSTSTSTDREMNKEVVLMKTVPSASLHHSLILPEGTSLTDNKEMINRCIQKSHSTHDFWQGLDNESTALRHSLSAGDPHLEEELNDVAVHEQFSDTNIRHNDRYPEANDVDNLDNEIVNALTLETGNLPDLTEEQSSSIDESRRDEWFAESLYIENLRYLNRILCFDQEVPEGRSSESEGGASGDGCEHLHLVLKYWHYLVIPYPEIRQTVAWGQVRCYCPHCQPDAQPPLAGWVRIGRIDGAGATKRGYWHVSRSTLGSAQVTRSDRGAMRRPFCLPPKPSSSPLRLDFWFDEEGKPHQSILAIEIDVGGSEPENDRLLAFLIFLKPYVPSAEDSSPSLDEEDE